MARLLLDENMPRLLGRSLLGHDVSTVQRAGWSGVKNGELLKRAAEGFDVFVTMDRNIPFQQSVAVLDIAVAVIRTPSSKLVVLEPLVPAILGAVNLAKPGTVTTVGEWP